MMYHEKVFQEGMEQLRRDWRGSFPDKPIPDTKNSDLARAAQKALVDLHALDLPPDQRRVIDDAVKNLCGLLEMADLTQEMLRAQAFRAANKARELKDQLDAMARTEKGDTGNPVIDRLRDLH